MSSTTEFAELHEAIGGGYPGEMIDALWSLVWRGLVTNDTFHALRAYVAKPVSSRPAKRQHNLPAFRSRRTTPPSAQGRWALVARPERSTAAAQTEWSHALALQLLSDQSAFLNPPANEVPATSPPDTATQQKMLDAARAYAVQIWSRMPNFFVTRVTNRFDDAPHALAKGDWPVDMGLQPTGNVSRRVAFRDGKEVQDATAAPGNAQDQQELGLRSWGEFGPALTVVLADMAQHAATFSHWEQTSTGLAAVFDYTVPREASHYAVAFGYLSETVIGRTQFGYSGLERSPQQVANIPREKTYQTYLPVEKRVLQIR